MLNTMSDEIKTEGIDWEAVWKSLDWDAEDRQQQTIHERLRQRAAQYATPLREDRIEGETYTVLTFALGSETYGVDVTLVQGVRAVTKITRVPGAPHFYRGVINVRGQIISVIDLRTFFEIDGDEQDPPRELIVVRANQLEIGLLARHVEGVMTVPQAAVELLEDMRYALGVTMERLVVLNIATMLEDERLIVGGGDE
jgi:purine-binding chemotaxis protein CheW